MNDNGDASEDDVFDVSKTPISQFSRSSSSQTKCKRINSTPENVNNDQYEQVKNGVKDNTTKDLSRSESMRLSGAVHRAFRPSEFIEEEILGNGFFASATKVYHKTSGETMVSKRLHRYEGEERDCFLKEVKVLRSIRHKNVLRFIGVIYKGDCINLVTEYVECGTLKESELLQ